MTEQEPVSICCKAPVEAQGDVTHWYRCLACGLPCDTVARPAAGPALRTGSRRAFEEWKVVREYMSYEAHLMPCESDWFKRGGDNPADYALPGTQEAWEAWQAARRCRLLDTGRCPVEIFYSDEDGEYVARPARGKAPRQIERLSGMASSRAGALAYLEEALAMAADLEEEPGPCR